MIVILAKVEKWCMDAPFTNQRMEKWCRETPLTELRTQIQSNSVSPKSLHWTPIQWRIPYQVRDMLFSLDTGCAEPAPGVHARYDTRIVYEYQFGTINYYQI